jgi:hypothetical protein
MKSSDIDNQNSRKKERNRGAEKIFAKICSKPKFHLQIIPQSQEALTPNQMNVRKLYGVAS